MWMMLQKMKATSWFTSCLCCRLDLRAHYDPRKLTYDPFKTIPYLRPSNVFVRTAPATLIAPHCQLTTYRPSNPLVSTLPRPFSHFSCSCSPFTREPQLFFCFPGMADDALRLGPVICISCELKNQIERSGSSCTVTICGNEKRKTRQTQTNPGRPANPPARFAFRLANNGEATADRGQSPNKKQQTPIATRQRGKAPSMPYQKTCKETQNELRTSTMSNRRKDSCAATLKMMKRWNSLYIRKFILSESSQVCFF